MATGGGGRSFLGDTAQDVPANAAALSFADPGVSRPVDLQEQSRQSPQPWTPPVFVRAALIAAALYFAPAVALFQQHFKESQKKGGSDACNYLWKKIIDGHGDGKGVGNRTEILAARRLSGREYFASGNWEVALDGYWGMSMVKTSRETAGSDGWYFDEALQHRECVWYLVETPRATRGSFIWKDKEKEHCGKASVATRASCDMRPGCAFFEEGEAPAGEEGAGCYFKTCIAKEGRTCYKRAIHSYDKGVALFIQSLFALFAHWLWAYLAGGQDMLMACFDTSHMRKFAVVGCLFGFSAVFGFLGQSKLTPGSYLIIAQSSIIVVPILWRVIFRNPIPVLSWVHIFMTAVGIYMYFLADMESGGGEDSIIGIVFSFTKVLMSGIAAVNSDRYLKTLRDLPLPVQVSLTLPFKAAACLATTFILPPHRFPPAQYRPGWCFHDMNSVVFVVLLHSLFDTIISGVVVGVFDAVVKALVQVCGIIFPTWVVSYLLGWDQIDFTTDQGKLKVSGALVVVTMAFAYVLGRTQAKALDTKRDRVAELEAAARALQDSPMKTGIELPSKGP